MSTDTTPPVGTIMKWSTSWAEVVCSSVEYMVVRDGIGRFYALEPVDGKWLDHDGDVWEIVTPEPPTLPVGTVLKYGSATRTVVGAAPGFVLVLTESGHRNAMAWMANGWRTASDASAWEVRP